MLCIRLQNNDPFYCLAAEEYLLKNFTDDIFMLWQSNDTIVVGKHQNAMSEINYPFVHRNKIKVARRISGGGTVFHDEGNVNFCFIKNVAGPSEISFRRFVQPVIEALGELDVQAVTSGRNDILVGGKKISGNAEHIFKNRVLHHGTLLFNSNLEMLGQSIRVVQGKYHGKAVQSNRSEVTNILPFLKNEMTADDFISFLMNFYLGKQGSSLYEITEYDSRLVQKLADEKFCTWDWNFGYSPRYTFKNHFISKGKTLNVELQVEKGRITESNCSGDFLSEGELNAFNESLSGMRHFYPDVRQKLEKFYVQIPEELVFGFF
jgi:lipoate---protein ligase